MTLGAQSFYGLETSFLGFPLAPTIKRLYEIQVPGIKEEWLWMSVVVLVLLAGKALGLASFFLGFPTVSKHMCMCIRHNLVQDSSFKNSTRRYYLGLLKNVVFSSTSHFIYDHHALNRCVLMKLKIQL